MKKIKFGFNVGIKSIILIAFAAALIAVDLLTKHFAKIDGHEWFHTFIPGWLEINAKIGLNTGIAFGLFKDQPHIGQPIIITLTVVMIIALIAGYIVMPERHIVLKTAMAIVFAGAVGNLVDRFMFFGVRDWFGLRMFGSMTYCNIADFCIVIGAALAIIDLLFFNEWALFPLTERARTAQNKRIEAESAEKEEVLGEFKGELDQASEEEKRRHSAEADVLCGSSVDKSDTDGGEDEN